MHPPASCCTLFPVRNVIQSDLVAPQESVVKELDCHNPQVLPISFWVLHTLSLPEKFWNSWDSQTVYILLQE